MVAVPINRMFFPLITDVCEIECDRNQLEFTVQVGNEGLADYFGDVGTDLSA